MLKYIFKRSAFIKKATVILIVFMQLSQLQSKERTLGFYSPTTGETFSSASDIYFQQLKELIIAELKDSWCSPIKIELMMDLIYQTEPKVCVEIGVFGGSSLLPIAATLRYLRQGHVYAIDAWSNVEAVKYLNKNDPHYVWWSKVDMQAAQNACQTLIDKWRLGSCCSLVPASAATVGAAQLAEIDFLHLDGNFTKEGSLADVELFLPKVKKGGYILLSNLYKSVNNQYPKMASMWKLFDCCEIIWNDDPNTALFRKS